MLKNLSLCVVLIVSSVLLACAAPKKKAPEGPIGGTEGGAMSPAISSTEMNFKPEGSDSDSIPGLHTVHFDYDSSTLSADARKTLSENAAWIKRNANTIVQIEGHCDSRGSVEYNLALGERRALSVKNYLVGLGVNADNLTVISFGEEKPIAIGDTEEAYAKNRRANFSVPQTKLPNQASAGLQ